VGPLEVAGVKRLVLVTEFGDEGRPQGAYPLDIGDHVDWLMPFVTLDENAGKRLQSLRRFVPGWQNWNLDPGEAARVRVAPYWDDARERWLPVVRLADGKQLSLNRTLSSVSYANDIVEVLLAYGEESPPAIELRVDGTPLEPVVHEDGAAGRVEPGPREEESGKGKWADGDPPKDNNAGDTAAKDKPTRYTERTVRWDLQSYRGRAVRLGLNVSFDRHPKGLVWHECIVKSAIANLPPGGQPLRPQIPLTSLQPLAASAQEGGPKPTPNRLPTPGKALVPITFLGQRFENGYGMFGGSTISFPVDRSYKRFVAVVGCCSGRAGPFQVLLDDQVTWETGAMDCSMQTLQMGIDIPPGTKTLTLETTSEGHHPGYSAWVNAGFVK